MFADSSWSAQSCNSAPASEGSNTSFSLYRLLLVCKDLSCCVSDWWHYLPGCSWVSLEPGPISAAWSTVRSSVGGSGTRGQVNVVFIWSMSRWDCLQYLGLWGSRRLKCLLQDLQMAGLLPGVYVGMAPTVSLGRLLRWHRVVTQVGMIGPNCNQEGLELSQGLLQGPWLEQIYRPVLRGTDRCASCQICG